ncbi:MAG: MBOAT family protein [Flavobacteriales bacterium]|nr:MBOAT family protein [Flavobacteriales bacterium]
MLLIASYYFYMGWEPIYASLLFLTTAIDYVVANRIQRTTKQNHRKLLLIVSICCNLGILFYFKYYNFFIENINDLAGSSLTYTRFLLPVGVSFYTFQEMGYVIDVYRGGLKAERHFGKFALFVSYFPQLVAGPIERASNLMHQLKENVELRYENFSAGGKKIIWGLFKKVVIADNLSPLVDQVYLNPENYSWYWLLIATYFFAIQIYCDFSGYSDIAIGVARTMGVRLMENFRLPYLSRSIREFWSRWHISLSTWFRDYLYIPLGGNRLGARRTQINLLLVFIISGFWHGAEWTFIIWGALHGLYLVFELILSKRKWWNTYSKGPTSWQSIIGTFILFQLVSFAWIFFRADNSSDAFTIIKNLFTLFESDVAPHRTIQWLGLTGLSFKIFLILSLFIGDKWIHGLSRGEFSGSLIHRYRMALYAALIACIVFLGNWGEVQFIYFQF